MPPSADLTAARKKSLIKAISSCGCIAEACRELGINNSTHYKWREKDPAYAQAVIDAFEAFADSLESEAVRRGRDGWERPVFQGGKLVGVERRYSDALLLAALKAHRGRLYKDRIEHAGDKNSPIVSVVQTEYVDDWYGSSSEAAEAAEASAERAAQLEPLQDAGLRAEMGEDGDGAAGDAQGARELPGPADRSD